MRFFFFKKMLIFIYEYNVPTTITYTYIIRIGIVDCYNTYWPLLFN